VETQEYKNIKEDRERMLEKAQQIYNKYVQEDGQHSLTLSFQLRQEIEASMKSEINLYEIIFSL